MGEVYDLQNSEDRQKLVEKFSEFPGNGNSKGIKQNYIEKKMYDARRRGLFNTTIDFSSIRHRILVTEAASAASVFLSDPNYAESCIFPEAGVHSEWFVNCQIYRTPVLILSRLEDFVLQVLCKGIHRLPTPKHIEVALLVASEFEEDEMDNLTDFLIALGKRRDPRARKAERLLEAAREVVTEALLDGEDEQPIETALYLYDHKITNDPHQLWEVLSGNYMIASYNSCLLPSTGRVLYMLFPREVYEHSNHIVEVRDFDLVTDPIQAW